MLSEKSKISFARDLDLFYLCSLLKALPMTAIAETSAAFLGSGSPNLRVIDKLRECQVFKSMLNMCCTTSKEKNRGCT